MDKWFKYILPDKDPYHNRGRDQMRKTGGPDFKCLCNYPRKKLFNGTNYGSYRIQICLVSCSISTCFIKGKTSYGRHYHKFCSWRATISTILNNATAQYFPVATHAADTKQFKFNITCSNESQYTCFIVGYGRR